MKEFLNKLNGWQRLFVAFLVFAYIPVAVINISQVKYRDWQDFNPLLEKLSDELLLSLKNKETVLNYSNDGISWDLAADDSYSIFMAGSTDDDWTYRVFVQKKLGDVKAQKYADEITKAIKDRIFSYKFKERALLTLYYLLGAVGIYLFGWTLGWIYKGFRKQS